MLRLLIYTYDILNYSSSHIHIHVYIYEKKNSSKFAIAGSIHLQTTGRCHSSQVIVSLFTLIRYLFCGKNQDYPYFIQIKWIDNYPRIEKCLFYSFQCVIHLALDR